MSDGNADQVVATNGVDNEFRGLGRKGVGMHIFWISLLVTTAITRS